MDLKKAGNRERRQGITFEDGFFLSRNRYGEGDNYRVCGLWREVGGDPTVSYVVVQAGKWLIFYLKGDNALSALPITSGADDYRVDLNLYVTENNDMSQSLVQTTSIDGTLVVVGEKMDSFYIEYDPDTDTFTETEIVFEARDFEWQGTTTDYYNPVADSEITDARKYDTYNAGWNPNETSSSAALTRHLSQSGNQWPQLTLAWHAAKDGTSQHDYTVFNRLYKGTSLIANGSFILNLFDKDRATVSGLSSLPRETTTERFSTVTTFSGRVWYAGFGSRIYFTQIFENSNEYGKLYQINDPTSETFSDLLDTDGGFINIPEANNVRMLQVFGASLLVFADNGVWRISGVDGVFRATEYSVFKITGEGLPHIGSFVSGRNGLPFWWSYTGIHTIQVTDDGGMVEKNISLNTIQTLWNNISGDGKQHVRGVYDKVNNRVLWLYMSDDETIAGKQNEVLILDIELGAFFPWRFSDNGIETPQIYDGVFLDSAISGRSTLNVVAQNENDQVVDSSGNVVTASANSKTQASSSIRFLTRLDNGQITFSTVSSTTFLDWGEADYLSYAEAAFDFMGDLGRRKTGTYITVFLKATESSWVESGNTYVFDRPSSCLVQSFWDFKVLGSKAQQAYRFKRPLLASADLSYDPAKTVYATRLKMRGRGRVVKIRFESETGKDMNLLGWEIYGGVNPGY